MNLGAALICQVPHALTLNHQCRHISSVKLGCAALYDSSISHIKRQVYLLGCLNAAFCKALVSHFALEHVGVAYRTSGRLLARVCPGHVANDAFCGCLTCLFVAEHASASTLQMELKLKFMAAMQAFCRTVWGLQSPCCWWRSRVATLSWWQCTCAWNSVWAAFRRVQIHVSGRHNYVCYQICQRDGCRAVWRVLSLQIGSKHKWATLGHQSLATVIVTRQTLAPKAHTVAALYALLQANEFHVGGTNDSADADWCNRFEAIEVTSTHQ